MGYCLSESELPEEVRENRFKREPHAEFPDEIIPWIVGGEIRRESFILHAENDGAPSHHDSIELPFDQIPRLRAILDFIENRYK